MNVASIQPKIDASRLPLESLANNKALTEDQKVGEASRQFEAILLQQFLSESQKPVITSEFTDNSARAAGIYQDFITNQLADSLSRGGGIGLAKSFQRQLTHPAPPHAAAPLAGRGGNAVAPAEHAAALLKTETHGPASRAVKKISHP